MSFFFYNNYPYLDNFFPWKQFQNIFIYNTYKVLWFWNVAYYSALGLWCVFSTQSMLQQFCHTENWKLSYSHQQYCPQRIYQTIDINLRTIPARFLMQMLQKNLQELILLRYWEPFNTTQYNNFYLLISMGQLQRNRPVNQFQM